MSQNILKNEDLKAKNKQRYLQSTMGGKPVIKLQIPITVLAVIALPCYFIMIFMSFSFENGLEWETSFGWEMVCSILIGIIPIILLILYVVFFYRNPNFSFTVPLIFGFQLLASIVFAVMVITSYPGVGNVIISTVQMLLYVCMFIGALGGFKIKLLLIIPIVINMIVLLYNKIGSVMDIDFSNIESVIYTLANVLGILCFNLALILFVSKNRIIMNHSAKDSEQTVEQALLSLRSEYEDGLISQEEYDVRRGEIIKKL